MLSGPALFAQQSIRGTVVDARTGQPVRGTSISVVGTIFGTISLEDGTFAIKASGLTFPVEIQLTSPLYQDKKILLHSPEIPVKARMVKTGETDPTPEISRTPAMTEEYLAKLSQLHILLESVQVPPMTDPKHPAFVIGVLGTTPFGDDLYMLQAIRVSGRPVKVVWLASLAQIGGQDALLISQPDKAMAEALNEALFGTQLLTIGDRAEDSGLKTVITLTYTDKKAAFTLNKSLAAMAGISFPTITTADNRN